MITIKIPTFVQYWSPMCINSIHSCISICQLSFIKISVTKIKLFLSSSLWFKKKNHIGGWKIDMTCQDVTDIMSWQTCDKAVIRLKDKENKSIWWHGTVPRLCPKELVTLMLFLFFHFLRGKPSSVLMLFLTGDKVN